MKEHSKRILRVIKDVLPSTAKTALWIIKITVSVSLAIFLLDYVGFVDKLSLWLGPVFSHLGLPGEASLAFISGYFVNVYSAIAVIATLELDFRATTILGVMILCAHNIIGETAVQNKTGSSFLRIVVIRTFSAIFLAFVLNLVLPGKAAEYVGRVGVISDQTFVDQFGSWLVGTLKLILKMSVLIFSLSILNRILTEYGVIHWLCKYLRPVMLFFGLPEKTGFMWLVANTLGLAYGGAIMMEETRQGNVSFGDADLLNHHIAISHSNLEDLLLLVSVGAGMGIMLIARWLMALVLVWERRLEREFLISRFSLQQVDRRR
jgi:hypothetical protein